MKKLLQKFFGMKPKTKKVQIWLNAYSQGYVIKERMKAADLKHAEEAIVNLDRVRISKVSQEGLAMIYFCPLGQIDVVKRLSGGDDCWIPEGVTVEGLQLELPADAISEGLYSVKNVHLYTNGTIQLTSTANTKVELLK